eukprot:scaffold8245_cov97-Isochrysis_galbana.AAC.2
MPVRQLRGVRTEALGVVDACSAALVVRREAGAGWQRRRRGWPVDRAAEVGAHVGRRPAVEGRVCFKPGWACEEAALVLVAAAARIRGRRRDVPVRATEGVAGAGLDAAGLAARILAGVVTGQHVGGGTSTHRHRRSRPEQRGYSPGGAIEETVGVLKASLVHTRIILQVVARRHLAVPDNVAQLRCAFLLNRRADGKACRHQPRLFRCIGVRHHGGRGGHACRQGSSVCARSGSQCLGQLVIGRGGLGTGDVGLSSRHRSCILARRGPSNRLLRGHEPEHGGRHDLAKGGVRHMLAVVVGFEDCSCVP